MISPSIEDLEYFFEVQPIELENSEGMWMFKVHDQNGVCLVCSFSEIEASFQMSQKVNDLELAVVSSEKVESVKISKDKSGEYLLVTMNILNTFSQARIWLRPYIKIGWCSI